MPDQGSTCVTSCWRFDRVAFASAGIRFDDMKLLSNLDNSFPKFA